MKELSQLIKANHCTCVYSLLDAILRITGHEDEQFEGDGGRGISFQPDEYKCLSSGPAQHAIYSGKE
jgi:hypothetical protein